MLDESYTLIYSMDVLTNMSEAKRDIFVSSLKKFVISTVQTTVTREIQFLMYQDHFLEAVARWPWLLCSDLGAHLESYSDRTEYSYQSVVQNAYGKRNP